eukprot:gene2795-12670_t
MHAWMRSTALASSSFHSRIAQLNTALAPWARFSCAAAAAAASAPSDPNLSGNAHSLHIPSIASQEQKSPKTQHGMVLDGKRVASEWIDEMAGDVQQLVQKIGRPPSLAVLLVGNRPDSILYVTRKQEACQKAGVGMKIHHLPEEVSQGDLDKSVQSICLDPAVDGVLIQLPLPKHLSEESVMELLDPRKDVDGFHPLNMGRMLMRGRGQRLLPCTPLGCIQLLRREGVIIKGRSCVVVGDSNIVGTPIAAMMRDLGAATVTICHRISYQDRPIASGPLEGKAVASGPAANTQVGPLASTKTLVLFLQPESPSSFTAQLFQDSVQVQQMRSHAAACLPQLPGPSRSVAEAYEIHEGDRSARSNVSTSDVCSSNVSTSDVCSSNVGHSDISSFDASSSNVSDSNVSSSTVSGSNIDGSSALEKESRAGFGESRAGGDKSRAGFGESRAGGDKCSNPVQAYQSHQQLLSSITRTADILVVAVGHSGLVKADWVKPGAVVLDVGINVIMDPQQPPKPTDAESSSQQTKASGIVVVGDARSNALRWLSNCGRRGLFTGGAGGLSLESCARRRWANDHSCPLAQHH